MTALPPRDPFSEVVDERRRWNPEWYSWLQEMDSRIEAISTSLALYAPLASPTFTGDPLAPTPAVTDSDTSIATTAFVTSFVAHGLFYVGLSGDQSGNSAGAFNKINFNVEGRDDNSWFDNSTNFRYTPLIAGYYLIGLSARLTYNSVANDAGQVAVYRNNTIHTKGSYFVSSGNNTVCSSNAIAVVNMNGSSDFVDGRAYFPSINGVVESDTDSTIMFGFRLKA